MLENNKNAVTVIYSGGDIQVPFLFFDAADLMVLYEIMPKTLGTDYTVAGAGNEGGGKITLVNPPVDGTRVTVLRKVDFTQLLQVPANGILPEGALNRALDRIVMMVQQLAEQAERAVTYPEGTEKDEVANAGEMLDSIDKARADINNAVAVAGTTLDTANEKLGEINTVSAATLQEIEEQQQRNEESVTKAEDAAARAQSLPIGHVMHGFWKEAPAGTLALRMAKWPIASFSDLYQMAVDAGIAVPKATYDAIKAAKGSVGFFGIDEDGVSFWTPHLEDIAVAPTAPDMAGFETGDINLASLPEVAGTFTSTYNEATESFKLIAEYSSFQGGTNPISRKEFRASYSSSTYGADGDDEVRTKRVHLLFCVVAYSAVRPAAVAEMTAMLASITQLQQDVQELQVNKVGYPDHANRISLPTMVDLVQQAPADGYLFSYTPVSSSLSLYSTDSEGVRGGYMIVNHCGPYGTYQSTYLPIMKGEFFEVAAITGQAVLYFIPLLGA
ncbi:hypothetical protein [Halodesulfovibrio aestuarii]|uniref:Phage tail protein n=1 Tax=Halodesulfovibrio aestuarii TaxID=126333 RepID=A0ABV4JRR8_9BACT